jgi:hypothetical protein
VSAMHECGWSTQDLGAHEHATCLAPAPYEASDLADLTPDGEQRWVPCCIDHAQVLRAQGLHLRTATGCSLEDGRQ